MHVPQCWSGLLPPLNGYGGSCASIDDVLHEPIQQGNPENVDQNLATCRESQKALKSTRKNLWTPLLDSALLEALRKYYTMVDQAGRPTRMPPQNVYISNYIYAATGEERSNKQVSNRIQTLKFQSWRGDILSRQMPRMHTSLENTCSQFYQVFRVQYPPLDLETLQPTPTDQENVRSFSPNQDALQFSSTNQEALQRPSLTQEITTTPYLSPVATTEKSFVTHILINLVDDTSPVPIPVVYFIENSAYNPQHIFLPTAPGTPVRFLSTAPLFLQSTFTMFVSSSNIPICTQTALLKCLTPPADNSSAMLYESDILPAFWSHFFMSRELSNYTMTQTLRQVNYGKQDNSNLEESTFQFISETIVVYRFVALRSTPTLTRSEIPSLDDLPASATTQSLFRQSALIQETTRGGDSWDGPFTEHQGPGSIPEWTSRPPLPYGVMDGSICPAYHDITLNDGLISPELYGASSSRGLSIQGGDVRHTH